MIYILFISNMVFVYGATANFICNQISDCSPKKMIMRHYYYYYYYYYYYHYYVAILQTLYMCNQK